MDLQDTELVALAAAVADGSRIDWARAESSAADDDERQVVQRLRSLAQIFAAHGDAPTAWGPFSIRHEIGRGSYGVVYHAWDTRLERDIAVKLLHRAAIDPEALGDFLKEGRLLASVRHPNVVTVYGADLFNDRVGIWMEFIAGHTLRDLVSRNGPFGASEAALIGRDVCRALSAVHREGILHRDIKAQNVMRESGGRTVVMDFGAGERLLPQDDVEATLTGTPLYTAPEVLDGGRATVQSDVYSVGVLLHFLVSGEFPVVADSIADLRRQHHAGRVRLLRDLRPNLPPAFLECIEQATAASSSARPQSAGALERLLTEAIGSDDSDRPPLRMRHDAAPRASRSGWKKRGAAAVLAVGVALTAAWYGLPLSRPSVGAALAPGSVAILPFTNLTGDAANAYFSDGITQDLAAQLATLKDIRVIAGNSTRRYQNSDKPETTIASELGVASVLLGSVRQEGDRVRIVSALVDGRTGTQLWSETFERQRGDVFALQTEVARKIAIALKGELAAADVAGLAPSGGVSFEAFNLYLKGRYYFNTRTEDGLNRALQNFQDALRLEPSYAEAEAGIADTYIALANLAVLPRVEANRRAAEHASRAVTLNPGLAEAHASLGYARKNRFEWGAAESSFRRALELKPGVAATHHWYAILLTQQGRFAEATTEMKAAISLDPLSITATNQLGNLMMMARRFDEALRQYQRVLEMDPSFPNAYRSMGSVYGYTREFEAARQAFERARASGPAAAEDQELKADWACMQARAGQSEAARATAKELANRHDLAGEQTAGGVAAIYAALGDIDQAFAWLERARRDNDPELGYLKVHPKWDPLRGDARLSVLLTGLGFR